jgi:SMC interacting uncharacterized protein involved in chromosome segregation
MEINLVEIIIFQLGAVLLGFAIHFFIFSKRNYRVSDSPQDVFINEQDHSRLRMYEDMDQLESENERLIAQLKEANRLEQELQDEIKALRDEHLQLLEEQEHAAVQPQQPSSPETGYLEQIQLTQQRLLEHNQQIGGLLDQIRNLKESEQKHLDTIKENEQLKGQMRDMQRDMADKDAQLGQMQQQYALNRELQEQVEKAYSEFNTLQDKIRQMEQHISQPQNRAYELDEMQQSYIKLTRDFDEIKLRLLQVTDENRKLSRQLSDSQDKLQESNFQRQQLLKKVTYLEDLNKDLQQLSDHNKKLENQLRRITEIETLLEKLSGKPTGASDIPPTSL